jgi:hypothetical protein
MLTEGWDVNNATQVFGLRAFGSQLLCEQVVGRGPGAWTTFPIALPAGSRNGTWGCRNLFLGDPVQRQDGRVTGARRSPQ